MSAVYPHRIRLRGPWECQPLARADGRPLPASLRMTMPCRWQDAGLADFAGTIRFLRRFHWPSAIDSQERIWLTCAGLTGKAEVSLNGHPLGRHEGDGGCEFDVTTHLQARNELEVHLTAGSDGGLWGEAALEVRRTAYLRDVRVTPAAGFICVTGQVVGQSDRPLELYILFDNATVHYATIRPTPEGQGFCQEIKAEAVPAVRVELVDGGVVWYQVEKTS